MPDSFAPREDELASRRRRRALRARVRVDEVPSLGIGPRLPRPTPEERLAAVRSLQQWYRENVPEGVSLVDELIAERRAEAARE